MANGKRQPILDEKGNAKITYYSDAELEEKFYLVESIVDNLVEGDTDKFEFNVYKYAEEANSTIDDLHGTYYLKKNETSPYDYINTIRDALCEIEVGDIRVITSGYGYHIVMKYDIETGAYNDDDNATWFDDFTSDLMNKLMKTHTEKPKARIEVFDELLEDVSIFDVGINYYY